MRIVVSDSSCLIDLRKASLLDVFLRLPYEFLIPNTLFEEELLKFTDEEKNILLHGGLQVMDLPGGTVARGVEIAGILSHLSVHDGLAFALAESVEACVLLTGDAKLRTLSESYDMEVHGMLWLLDEIHRHGLAPAEQLAAVLRGFDEDPTVRLPGRELAALLRRLEKTE